MNTLPTLLTLASTRADSVVTDWVAIELVVLQFVAVFFLVFLNGFFVAAEFAIVKVRDSQLAELANQGTKRVAIARHVVAHLDAYLSATSSASRSRASRSVGSASRSLRTCFIPSLRERA